MTIRLPLPLVLLLFCVVCLAIQQLGRETSGENIFSGILTGEPESELVDRRASELVLVRTPDSDFLKESAIETTAGQEDEAAAAAESGAGGDGKSVVMSGDGKEVREPEIAGADGKEFKEVLDPKSMPPIAAGEATNGGGGGGGGGFGGGSGGGGPANEVAAFTEVREVENEDETIISTTTPVVINKTVIRTVPEVPPAVPVPEAGSALTGFGIAAIIFASFLYRRRPGAVG